MLVLLLAFAASSSLAALVLNSVSPDALDRGVPSATAICPSAHLFNGSDCAPHAQCSAQFFIDSVDTLKTEAPTSLQPSGLLSANVLELVVQHAAVKNRIVTSIVVNAANPLCNFPGPHWQKAVQANWAAAVERGPPICRDVYISSIPWTTDCALERTENATFVKFAGQGLVTYNDSLGEIDGVPLGMRRVASVIRFEVLQPRVIRDISSRVRVYDEPRLLGAVTRQIFDFRTGLARLQITLSLAAPVRTTALLQAVGPRGAGVTPVVQPGFGAGELDLTPVGDLAMPSLFRSRIETLTEFISLYNATSRAGRIEHNGYNYSVELVHKNAFLDVVDFGNRENDGNFYPNVGRIPLGQVSPIAGGEQYGVHVRALVTIPVGVWRIAIGGDDGLSLQLDDVRFTSEHGARFSSLDASGGPFGVGSNRIGYELPQTHRDTIGQFSVTQAPLTTMLRIYWFERTGQDSLELSIANVARGVAYPADYTLLRNGTHDWTVRAVDENFTFFNTSTNIRVHQIGLVDNARCADRLESGACLQRYEFEIDPKELCSFSGPYSFQWAVDCHPAVKGTPECPVDARQQPLDLVVDLESEDICATAQGLMAINGSITSHGDFSAAPFAFGPLKTAFFVDQRVHFQVVVQSVTPGFVFESSSIVLVEAVDATGQRRVLYDGESNRATPGWQFEFASDPNNFGGTLSRHIHQFSYKPTPAVFGAVARNQPVTSAVIVAVRVNFLNRFGVISEATMVKRFAVEKRQVRPPVTRDSQAITQITIAELPEISMPQSQQSQQSQQQTTTTQRRAKLEWIEQESTSARVTIATATAAAIVMLNLM